MSALSLKQKYGALISLGVLLLFIAGAGAYGAISTLLALIDAVAPAPSVLAAAVGRVTIMLAASFLAALFIALTSAIFIRKEFERRRRTEERLSRVLQTAEQAGDLITIVEKKGRIEYVNQAVEQTTGFAQKELVGKRGKSWLPWYTDTQVLQTIRDTVLSGNPYRAVVTCRKKNGDQFFLQEHVTPLKDSRGNIMRMLSTAREITLQKNLEDRLDYLDKYDPLTGAVNRRFFAERLGHEISRARRDDRMLSVMIMDIDRFKYINDLFGSEVGDEVLQRVSEILRSAVSEPDVVARLGSDEFGVIHLYGAQLIDPAAVAERIRHAISQKITIGGQDIVMTLTMGVAVYPDNGKDAKAVLKNADMALSRAKAQGRNTIQFFSAEINNGIQEFYLMEKRLFGALKNDEYSIGYQPFCDLTTKRVTGAEALIRWTNSDLGAVAPSRFVPTLEETGMIVDVGEWVLRTACRQIRDWKRSNRALSVAVNLSHLQFRHRHLVSMIAEMIRELGIDPRFLTLELTESICIHDIDFAITVLKKLKDVGVAISIDDFGTGYSSLSYVKKLPIDNLKIDMSFVRDVTMDPDAASIITAITSMARSLNLKTVAEGIETEEQLNILRLLRCDMGQGFYFGAAVPASDFDKFLVT